MVTPKSPVVVTVKARLDMPRAVDTTTGPVIAPIGTVVTMLLLVAVRTRAGTPLKLTATGAGVKPAPEIVTTVPGGPLDGARTVITGLTMTVNVRRAGVGS